MMKAKDTITKTNEENCHNTLEERLAEQAEISFKAGQKEIVEWIIAHKRGYYAKDGALISVISAEWTEEEWQAKLKEWGI